MLWEVGIHFAEVVVQAHASDMALLAALIQQSQGKTEIALREWMVLMQAAAG